MGPTECKYCGCDKFNADSVSMTRFCCGSSYWPQDKVWQIANGCAAKCAVQLVELRERVQQADQDIEFMKAREANFVTALRSRLRTLNERIQRAVEALEGARRICIGLCNEDGEDVESEHDGVIYVESTEADRAAAILRGNSPESPDSSPVTTDDLAVADYFEAVRQRVPWMVAVEHIEGLVEGYRRCGVMVWQTAEEIRKVHGVEYGKAD